MRTSVRSETAWPASGAVCQKSVRAGTACQAGSSATRPYRTGAWATLSAWATGDTADPPAGSCPKASECRAKIRQTGNKAARRRALDDIIVYNSPLYRSDEAGRGHFTRALPGVALNRHSRSAGDVDGVTATRLDTTHDQR